MLRTAGINNASIEGAASKFMHLQAKAAAMTVKFERPWSVCRDACFGAVMMRYNEAFALLQSFPESVRNELLANAELAAEYFKPNLMMA